MFCNALQPASEFDIHIVESTDEARHILSAGTNDTFKAPDIIFMSECGDREGSLRLLHTLRALPGHAHIPIVMLGRGNNAEAVYEAYDALANCYIEKPGEPEEYISLVQSLECFWFRVVKLPPRVE